jgi:hypothetical protein
VVHVSIKARVCHLSCGMSFSHNIHRHSQFTYPVNDQVDLSLVVQSVVNYYYGDFLYRLRDAGYSIPILDYYHTYFGEYTPASFVTDSRGNPVIRPGPDQRWLVFQHIDGVVKMYIGRYVVAQEGGLRLYGDGVLGVSFPLDASGSIVGVALNVSHIEKLTGAGVVFL